MIRRAEVMDLYEINQLLVKGGLKELDRSQLRDECLVADINGKIEGVIWAGVSDSRFLATIDYFSVNPFYSDLVLRLARQLVKNLDKMGVKNVLFFCTQRGHDWVPAKLRNRLSLYCPEEPFYLLMGEIKGMVTSHARRHSAPANSAARS
jgi:N-acetylglutamate synthase-like GNAT family acetyltransferase